MTIAKKISMLSILLMLLTVAVGVAGLVSVSRMNRYQEDTVNQAMPGLYQMTVIDELAKDMRIRMVMHILSSDQKEMTGYETEIVSLHDQVLAAFKDYEKIIVRSEDRELFRKIPPTFD